MNINTKMIMLILVLGSWGASAQHDHAKDGGHDRMKMDQKNMDASMVMFKDAQLGKVYENYISLKDALVASNKEDAMKAATELQKSLTGVKGGEIVAYEAAKVAVADNLEDQRTAFSGLSDMMAMLVKDGKLSMGMIYLDYCPMVNASWLSNDKEIKNPYYGDKMLTCGSVKEMIH
ncbi:MAG TPA: DUF3347 domain-containing protein [Cyclobacteriaceae bacterium]|jgi:hypothetical protein|nr:DUF3347 domain-containing protein [Cyclobacteriaceae bacterium]